jgi:hypothetical protein
MSILVPLTPGVTETSWARGKSFSRAWEYRHAETMLRESRFSHFEKLFEFILRPFAVPSHPDLQEKPRTSGSGNKLFWGCQPDAVFYNLGDPMNTVKDHLPHLPTLMITLSYQSLPLFDTAFVREIQTELAYRDGLGLRSPDSKRSM